MGPFTQRVQLGHPLPYAPVGPLPMLHWGQHHSPVPDTSLYGTVTRGTLPRELCSSSQTLGEGLRVTSMPPLCRGPVLW